MSSKDSIRSTLVVAFCLCVVCSILVSGAAVALKPLQDANKLLDRNKNILSAAGLYDPQIHGDDDVDMLFEQFTPRIVDLDQGRFLSENEIQELDIDITSFDQRRAETDPRYSRALDSQEDLANIKRRVNYAMVYMVEDEDGIDKVVLPISGYGLWGILYGFISLDGDADTVSGIGFYELKETPGLGAEVTNPNWRALWPGKKIYEDDGSVALDIVRGNADGESEVDGLAGATLTSQGVENLIRFWMGENGFGPFLRNISNS